MQRDPLTPAGTLHRLTINSEVLAGNLVGAPTRRQLDVYIPYGHDGRNLPLLVDVVGFTAGGPIHTNWKNFGENVPERLDRLIATGAMPPVVVAFPDCFTRLGGNQYVNSVAMGRWDDFLRDEVVPLVEAQFSCGGTGRRGLFGKSSGGYGAMVHALLHPQFWSAAAVHSGDMGFDLVYRHEFVPVLRALAKEPDVGRWVDSFWNGRKFKDSDVHILMMMAQAASFDPDPSAPYGVRMPVTLDTCELIPERWERWLAWDPLTLVETHGPGLKALKALYIDCGDVDQYNLVYGARRMHKRLTALGVQHVYEEFPDDHTAVDYRMDVSLPLLVKALG
ncbi:alpha/beta hydrolase [Roseateles terrae]|uniref:Enterochelin esterase-like enzyme n=1 Tax=Roseateles terrae TaxID=431060 RepID=A0ABR6GPL5_9BURK|nr:alpha/beta hydrolase-fold protein [Roseateles terrae]MBB3193123.1 enterochelin esterase-like enzyme [Roseateles terrae]OWQ89647.1 enterochelin esterase [Roseateles terrae]